MWTVLPPSSLAAVVEMASCFLTVIVAFVSYMFLGR